METPPGLPSQRLWEARLKIAFFTPLVLMAFSFTVVTVNADLAVPGMVAAFFSILICSITCAVLFGKWKGTSMAGGIGWALLAFIGLQVFYLTVFFGGCALALGSPDFR